MLSVSLCQADRRKPSFLCDGSADDDEDDDEDDDDDDDDDDDGEDDDDDDDDDGGLKRVSRAWGWIRTAI